MLTAVIAGRLRRLAYPLWLPAGLGTLGSLGIVLEGFAIGSGPATAKDQFWLHLPEGSYGVAHVLFYLSVALMLFGWLGVGVHALDGRLTSLRSWVVLALWGGPLFLGTPVFSRDVYSYIAQGELVRHGFNPYLVAPRALGPGPLLASVASVWRDTTSPYGPLFVALTHLGAMVAGSSLLVQVLIFRTIELLGVVVLMVVLPALARHLGANGGVAIWLGVLSPLSLFSAVSSAHNDTLMLALMVTALLVGLRGGRRWGVALFALAATIKLPALAGVVFLTASHLRSASRRERWQIISESIALTSMVIVLVTVMAGYGWTWLGPTALHIPVELRVLTTPTVAIGNFLAALLHSMGLTVSTSTTVTFTQYLCEVLAIGAVVMLILRTRANNVTRLLGIALLIVVFGSPTVWPWYFLWGLTVLAATSAQRSTALAIVAGLAMLLVGPGGTPMFGGNSFYVTGPLTLSALAWFFWSGQWRVVTHEVDCVD